MILCFLTVEKVPPLFASLWPPQNLQTMPTRSAGRKARSASMKIRPVGGHLKHSWITKSKNNKTKGGGNLKTSPPLHMPTLSNRLSIGKLIIRTSMSCPWRPLIWGRRSNLWSRCNRHILTVCKKRHPFKTLIPSETIRSAAAWVPSPPQNWEEVRVA